MAEESQREEKDPVWNYIEKHSMEWLKLRLSGIGIFEATEEMRKRMKEEQLF